MDAISRDASFWGKSPVILETQSPFFPSPFDMIRPLVALGAMFPVKRPGV